MEIIKHFGDMVGKKVKAVINNLTDDVLCIQFEEGFCAILEQDCGEFVLKDKESLSDYSLFMAGFFSEDEYETMKKEKTEKNKAASIERELALYETLHAKYGHR